MRRHAFNIWNFCARHRVKHEPNLFWHDRYTTFAVEVMFDNCFVCSHALCICFVLFYLLDMYLFVTHQSLDLSLTLLVHILTVFSNRTAAVYFIRRFNSHVNWLHEPTRDSLHVQQRTSKIQFLLSSDVHYRYLVEVDWDTRTMRLYLYMYWMNYVLIKQLRLWSCLHARDQRRSSFVI